jgi:hypothetical protein
MLFFLRITVCNQQLTCRACLHFLGGMIYDNSIYQSEKLSGCDGSQAELKKTVTAGHKMSISLQLQ